MAAIPSISDYNNASRATPNIDAANATLHLGSSTFISASSQRVWDVLIDTSTWPSWNSFVPRVTIRSQPDESDSPLPLSSVLQVGTKMTFHVCMDPGNPKPQSPRDTGLVVVEAIPPNTVSDTPGRIVWASDASGPGAFWPSLLTAERVHEITDVDGGVEVRNWENQVGWLVYAVKWMVGKTLKNNFDRWVQELKTYAENEARATAH